MRDIQKKSIKKRNIVLALFVLSVIGIVLSFFSFRREIKNIEIEEFKKSVRRSTKIKLENTKNHISDMVYDLNILAQFTSEYGSIWDPKVAEIITISNQRDIFNSIAVVDKNGNGYNQNGKQINVSEADYFKTAMQDTVAFSEVHVSNIMPGKYIQIFACPIRSKEQEVIGLVLGVIDSDELGKYITDQSVESEENLYIVDSNGNYISRFQIRRNNTRYINFWDDLEPLTLVDKDISEIKLDFEQRKEGEFSFYDNGEYRYGCYMPIGTRNWQIVYTNKDTVVSENLNTIFSVDNKHKIFTIVCYLIFLFCVIWYYRNINKEIKKAHEEVRKNIDILNIALENSKQPIFEYNQNRREIIQKTDFLNPLFQEIYESVAPESFVERNIIASKSVEPFMKLFESIKTQKYVKADIQVNNKTGVTWCRISLHNIYKENVIVGTVGFVEDITELKRIEKQTKRKLEIQEALIAKALLYVKVDMETECLIEINGEESRISFDEFLQQKVIENVFTKDKEYVLQELSLNTLRDKFQQGTDVIETQFIINFDGAAKWVSCMAYCNMIKRSKVILIITDIDKKKREEIELQYKAERDGLTGVYNSATVRVKIEKALASGYRLEEKQVFILLDLDNYKLINDTFGHDCGDQVLIEVAEIMKKKFRSSDIIGRLGGDEFVILLRNIRSYQYVEKVIKELGTMIYKNYSNEAKEVILSASIGVTLAPIDGHTFKELYEKSDKALYRVKKQGKNSYEYYNDSKEMLAKEGRLE